MSRPTTLKVDGIVYWSLMTYTDAGVLVDADSTPTVAIRKNGTATLDVVTVTKRAATTGIYDCSYNPASEVEGDTFTVEETALISSQAYVNSWQVKVIAAERGTENSSPSRYYTFNNNSGTDYADVYTEIDVAKNFPKVQKAIVRLKLSGSASSSSDWRLDLFSPAGGTGFDLLTGVTLPSSVSNYILQAEVDLTGCSVVDGSWYIVFEDFNFYGSVLSINDATVEFSDVPIASVGGDATAANQTAISNAISALNDFDPVNEAVANVTLVATCTTNSDMRGTDGANTVAPNTVAPDNASIAAILVDTADLQSNQGQWLTATTTVASNMRGTDGANTVAPNTIAPDNASITAIKAKTDQLAFTVSNQVDANALTGGGGDDSATIYSYFTASSREDAFKATGFNTVAPDNAGIVANGNAIAALADTTPQEFWDALTSGSYASGSFGERLLVSQGTQRTLQVTGSNHIAADVHEFQNDAITAAAIAADAVTELQTGLVTIGTAFTYTNGAGDNHVVTIS